MSTELPTVMEWLARQTFPFAISVSQQYKRSLQGGKPLSTPQINAAVRIYNEAAEKAAKPVLDLVAQIEDAATDPSTEVLAAIVAAEADVNAAIAGDAEASRRAVKALKDILVLVTGVVPEVDPREADIALLAANLTLVPAGRKHTFAVSLCSQYQQKGSLSPNQWPYVQQFAAEVRNVLAEAERLQQEAEAAIFVARVRDRLIALTGTDSKTHSIRFCIPALPDDPTDQDWFFGLIGWGANNTGAEKHVGAPGDVRTIALGAERTKALVEALMGLTDEAFLTVQGDYGRKMETCGRCGSPLTDKVSVAAGFGPECARKVL